MRWTLTGYDRKTDRLICEHYIPRGKITKVKRIAGVGGPPYACYPLTLDETLEITVLIDGPQIHAADYFLEATA